MKQNRLPPVRAGKIGRHFENNSEACQTGFSGYAAFHTFFIIPGLWENFASVHRNRQNYAVFLIISLSGILHSFPYDTPERMPYGNKWLSESGLSVNIFLNSDVPQYKKLDSIFPYMLFVPFLKKADSTP